MTRISVSKITMLAMLGCTILILAACGSSPPSRFYLLTPAELQPAAEQGTGSIALRHVVLPEYLDHPQMTSFVSSSELSYAEFDRWAEPLKENIRRVMLLNLGQLLPGETVQEAPSPTPASAKGVLVVRIQSFEANERGQLQLRASWSIHDPLKGTMRSQGSFAQSRTPADASFATRASEMSALLGALCVDIVTNMN